MALQESDGYRRRRKEHTNVDCSRNKYRGKSWVLIIDVMVPRIMTSTRNKKWSFGPPEEQREWLTQTPSPSISIPLLRSSIGSVVIMVFLVAAKVESIGNKSDSLATSRGSVIQPS